jgi:uncharacterized damage-inducible protein DinB
MLSGMSTVSIRVLAGVAALGLLALAQQKVPPGIGKGWLPEFDHAATQINALAEATPADKFSWRPGPGIRSISEVYIHLAMSNYFLLGQTGVKLPPDLAAKLKPDTEKVVTAKTDVIKWLKDSQQIVRENYAKVDRKRKVNFFSGETDAEGVLLRILVHNHEHMGQSIAYARMAGVTPPWSN